MSRILHLNKRARELGTYPVKFTVTDNSGLLVNAGNISTINWWLTDFSGVIINGRSNISLLPANPFYVVLSGNDLQITDKAKGENGRILTLRGTYDSTFGNDLPFTFTVSFGVINELVIDVELGISISEYALIGEDFGSYV